MSRPRSTPDSRICPECGEEYHHTDDNKHKWHVMKTCGSAECVRSAKSRASRAGGESRQRSLRERWCDRRPKAEAIVAAPIPARVPTSKPTLNSDDHYNRLYAYQMMMGKPRAVAEYTGSVRNDGP